MSLPSPGPRPTNVRWTIVLMLTGFTFLAHFNRVSISVAGNAEFIGPDKLSAEQMGLVYSAFLLVYTIGMLPGGYLIDRIGPRWAMTGMGLGLGFCAALTGVLGWAGLAVSAMLVPLLVIRGFAGAMSVPLHPGAARAVSLWVPLRERATANGLVTAGALVGIALTYPVFGWLMGAVGWPAAFVVCGATLMVFSLLWRVCATDDPAGHSRANAAERELVAGGITTPARSRATIGEVLSLFGDRSLVLLTLSYGALSYVQYMFFYWVEFYFGKVLKLPETESREASLVITLSMAVGMACGGWVTDRLSRWLGHSRGCRTIALLGMGLCAVFGYLGTMTPDVPLIIACFSLSLGTLGLCEGIFWTTAPALKPRNGALSCALVNTGGNGVGMLAPIVTPLLGQQYGWGTAVVVACVICGVGALLWLAIDPTGEPAPATEESVNETW